MRLAVRTDPHFLPVGVTTGSRQEDGLGAGLVVGLSIVCLGTSFSYWATAEPSGM